MTETNERKYLEDLLKVVEDNGFYYNGKFHKDEVKFVEEENNKWLDLRIKNQNAKNKDVILSSWMQNSIAFSVNFSKSYLLMNVLANQSNQLMYKELKQHIEGMKTNEIVSKSRKYGVSFKEIKNAQLYLLENNAEEKYISKKMHDYFKKEQEVLRKKVGSYADKSKSERDLGIIMGYIIFNGKQYREKIKLYERYEIANHILEHSKVINYSRIPEKPDSVVPGTIVKYKANEIIGEIELTGIFEGDIGKNVISTYSGFGTALLGKSINDEFRYAGAKMKILDIDNAKTKKKRETKANKKSNK